MFSRHTWKENSQLIVHPDEFDQACIPTKKLPNYYQTWIL